MDQVTNQARTEAILFVQKILNEFNQEILAAFYKQNRFHNNEISLLKKKLSHHQEKLKENTQREKEFKYLCEQARQSNDNKLDLNNATLLYTNEITPI